MRNGRSDMGQQMRSNGPPGAGMKRRWDNAGGSSDQGGYQNKRPYQPSAPFGQSAMNGLSSGAGYQPKPFRANNYDQNKPALAAAPSYQAPPSYGKFTGYTPMQMPPSLAQYPPIASAVANYTFPPPQSSIMPPLPKN